MKIYCTKSEFDDHNNETRKYEEFTSSAGDASKARTRLKKLKHEDVKTEELDVPTTRTELIAFLNKRSAHESWTAQVVAEKLEA